MSKYRCGNPQLRCLHQAGIVAVLQAQAIAYLSMVITAFGYFLRLMAIIL